MIMKEKKRVSLPVPRGKELSLSGYNIWWSRT